LIGRLSENGWPASARNRPEADADEGPVPGKPTRIRHAHLNRSNRLAVQKKRPANITRPGGFRCSQSIYKL